MKQFIKNLIPHLVLDVLRKIKSSRYGWSGNYKTWEEARKNSIDYDSHKIIKKVRRSLLKVKNGEAVYERDSVLFDEIQYSWPLLAELIFASTKSGGVKVLDPSGSLGSTSFQNKNFLDELKEVIWCIVEQKHFVDVGKFDFEDDRLKFYYDVKSWIKKEKPNILLLSSVLQYIEKPNELLDELLKSDFEFVIIDRTPFSLDNKEVIKVQVVPPWIYQASYLCWFFDISKMKNYLINEGYKIIEIFDVLVDVRSDEYEFKGFVMKKENDKQLY